MSTRAPSEPRDDGQRIAKLLARAGVASRREVERMIEEGRVALDGAVLTTAATVLPSLAGVTVDGNPVEAPAPARLFLYHKPAGLLVTERDPKGRPTIYDRLPRDLPRVVPVGRLDLATEGLLLLTTDGELKRQLELPATGVERAYRARTYGTVIQAQLEDLMQGVEIEGIRYGSINANMERRTGANAWIEMILTEGKNREVRRVLEYLGLQVSRLIRTRYGPFVLGDLPPGAVGEVRGHDIASFRKNPTRLDLPQPARARGSEAPVTRPVAAVAPRPAPPPPRPARSEERKPRKADAAKPGRPAKPARPSRTDDTVAKPARAARARAHREATGEVPRTPPSADARARPDRSQTSRPRTQRSETPRSVPAGEGRPARPGSGAARPPGRPPRGPARPRT